MELHVNHLPRNSFLHHIFKLKIGKYAFVIDIGEGHQCNRVRRIYPKSRALGKPIINCFFNAMPLVTTVQTGQSSFSHKVLEKRVYLARLCDKDCLDVHFSILCWILHL